MSMEEVQTRVDQDIDNIFANPSGWAASLEAIEAQLMLLFNIRELLKPEEERKDVRKLYWTFLKKRFGSSVFPLFGQASRRNMNQEEFVKHLWDFWKENLV